jgi:hypothetical protein
MMPAQLGLAFGIDISGASGRCSLFRCLQPARGQPALAHFKLAQVSAKGTAMGVYNLRRRWDVYGGVVGGWLAQHHGSRRCSFCVCDAAVGWCEPVDGAPPSRPACFVGMMPESGRAAENATGRGAGGEAVVLAERGGHAGQHQAGRNPRAQPQNGSRLIESNTSNSTKTAIQKYGIRQQSILIGSLGDPRNAPPPSAKIVTSYRHHRQVQGQETDGRSRMAQARQRAHREVCGRIEKGARSTSRAIRSQVHRQGRLNVRHEIRGDRANARRQGRRRPTWTTGVSTCPAPGQRRPPMLRRNARPAAV